MFKKVLIANRGEIALRIMRAAKELKIPVVTIHSDADINALHVLLSPESYHLEGVTPADTYLNIEKIIEIAKKSGADAIHPGYGFLSENGKFARACEENGITFIGPSPESMEAMGDKLRSRELAKKAGVPLIPGTEKPVTTIQEAKEFARNVGYPIILKASAGGGGRGMRLVRSEEELENSLESARRESLGAFGDDRIYIEKYLEEPHHIEIQIVADKFGNTFHLFERECSIQRRHQKVIEETPSPFIDNRLRHEIAENGVKIAKAVGYFNAGTVEFLVDKYKNFYFLEMNTRLQVEHPITELVTGIDIVKTQFKIAAGEKLNWKQEEIKQNGHAIEARIYAEDVLNNFNPSPGKIVGLVNPSNPGTRIDTGVYQGYKIPIYYDSMIAKLLSFGKTRKEAIDRMLVALNEYRLAGVKNNIVFHQIVMNSEKFLEGKYSTNFLNEFDYENKIKAIREKNKKNILLAASLTYNLMEKSIKSDYAKEKSLWKTSGRIESIYKNSFRLLY